MGKIISLSSDRSLQLRQQQLERRRQQAGCTCVIAPPPASPPVLEWTAAGWRCSECKAMISGKHP